MFQNVQGKNRGESSVLSTFRGPLRQVATSVGTSRHLLMLQRTISSSEQDPEDPCGDFELFPPSHLFGSIYQSRPLPRAQTAPVQKRPLSLPALLQHSAFLTSPLPRNFLLRCCIRRDRRAFRRITPCFFLHTSEGHRFLLAAKKRTGNKTANYLITTEETKLSVDSAGYLGKLRSNFLGTEFNLYTKGTNPSQRRPPVTHRADLGVVSYHASVLGDKGPRKLRVAIPALDAEGRRVVWRPAQTAETLASKFKAGSFQDMLTFFSKPHIWDESTCHTDAQAFVLQFSGSAVQDSAKNFQLIDDADDQHIYLQFGKVGADLFTLDCRWPFSPLQAFGIALSSLDSKKVYH